MELITEKHNNSFEKDQLGHRRDFGEISNLKKKSLNNAIYNKKRKAHMIIIPLNEDNNKYERNEDDLIFENKEYITSTIEKFNFVFNSNKFKELSKTKNILLITTYVLMILGIIYCSILISLFYMYNPMILFLLIYVMAKIIERILGFHYKLIEKNKTKKMINYLLEESEESFNKYNLIWGFGRDGLWLELLKVDR